MTTRIRLTLTDTATPVTPVEVIDLRDNTVAATLRAEGDVFEDSIHGDKQFLVLEAQPHGTAAAVGSGGPAEG